MPQTLSYRDFALHSPPLAPSHLQRVSLSSVYRSRDFAMLRESPKVTGPRKAVKLEFKSWALYAKAGASFTTLQVA